MKRKDNGRFTRCYNPVARRKVYVEPEYHAVDGRHGLAWEHMGEGLVKRAPYSPEDIGQIRQAGGIPRLVDHVLPLLHGERRMRLIQNIESIAHAKQRAANKGVYNKGRRLSRKQRRKLDKVKALKALLNNK